MLTVHLGFLYRCRFLNVSILYNSYCPRRRISLRQTIRRPCFEKDSPRWFHRHLFGSLDLCRDARGQIRKRLHHLRNVRSRIYRRLYLVRFPRGMGLLHHRYSSSLELRLGLFEQVPQETEPQAGSAALQFPQEPSLPPVPPLPPLPLPPPPVVNAGLLESHALFSFSPPESHCTACAE